MAGNQYDIIIVGGGPVGLTMALALGRSMKGLRVALVDRRPFTVPRDQRSWALAAGVKRIFVELGVWTGMAVGAEPVRQMKITDSGAGDISRPLFLHFEGDVAPGEPFAHLVPNGLVIEQLLGALGPEVEIVAPAEITEFVADAGAARLTLADGRTLDAQLVIAADGAQSWLRNRAGIGTINHDYRQVGLVATIAHELPHQGTAYEHFRPAGPFASLPLPGNRSSLVWTETPERAAALRTWPQAEVEAEIEAVMGSTLGRVTLEEPLQSFPLRLQIARSFVGRRLALIGDAAHVIHPVAGQGLNLGLKDVAALAQVAIEALRLGQDAGGDDVLERYQHWRRFDTALMVAVTDGMVRLFSNDVAAVRAIRDFGMGLVERMPPVKDFLIARASGLDRNGPRLLRGLPI
ncbi:MAG: FAD-dependent monooxygenase [Devosia sp.]|uniref:FAD-dependent monooxygenase n=1 Tax=Devosia sp. TaxID=1871048 RepID=UPI001AC50600|nr:FAD-dependent monooxygenase [Devosia sp.]MBN9316633.1 FAD-dependent monooxygenase [Devosia sp.]